MIFLEKTEKTFLIILSKGGMLWCQNSIFFFNFSKFLTFFFQKQLQLDKIDSEINKVKDFGDSSHKTVEMPACFRLFGPKTAPLSRNRVNNFLSFLFAFTYKGNSLSNPRKKKLTFTVKYEQTSSQKLFNMNNLLTSNQGVVSSDTYFQALKET